MEVSYKWLQEYMDLSEVAPEELGEKISLSGLEVEEIKFIGEDISGLVVGEVLTCQPMEGSDKLSETTVDVGGQTLNILCGASNVREGQKVIVAAPGAILPGGFEISEREMNGKISQGMICSLDELGFPENVIPKKYADGIFVLPEDSQVGDPVDPYLGLDDAVFDIDTTPNRADTLSMRGMAHEVGAILDVRPNIKDRPILNESDKKTADAIALSVEDEEDTPIYSLRLIEDVEIKESPLWLQRKLMAVGLRPIDNVVDVTNYIMMEYGQPLHSYDYDQIETRAIHVRRAQEGESVRTLDGKDRQLTPENIVITDGQDPIGVAGVMGGESTHISDSTQNVLLEAAVFHPIATRRSAKALNLRSEASSRFEKGVNIAAVYDALDHAAQLIAELGGGRVAEGMVKEEHVQPEVKEIEVSLDYIRRYIGMDLAEPVILDTLDRLGLGTQVDGDLLTVSVPPRRWDLAIPADIVEEVARIYGYNNIPSTLPKGEWRPAHLTETQAFIRHSNAYMEGVGLNQAITYSLMTEDAANSFVMTETDDTRLAWPMSEEHQVLRKALIPGLLQAAQYNHARSMNHVFLYETGRVYLKVAEGDALLDEEERIAGFLMGDRHAKDWMEESGSVDFYTVKGIVEGYLDSLNLKDPVSFEAASDRYGMHPGRTANIIFDQEVIGYLGQIHPKIQEAYDLDEAYVFEIQVEPLIEAETDPNIQEIIPIYPGTDRDIALLVDESVTHRQIMELIRANGSIYLQDVELFDYYVGDSIPEGKKSLAYRLYYQNPNKTLEENEVNENVSLIQERLVDELDVEVR